MHNKDCESTTTLGISCVGNSNKNATVANIHIDPFSLSPNAQKLYRWSENLSLTADYLVKELPIRMPMFLPFQLLTIEQVKDNLSHLPVNESKQISQFLTTIEVHNESIQSLPLILSRNLIDRIFNALSLSHEKSFTLLSIDDLSFVLNNLDENNRKTLLNYIKSTPSSTGYYLQPDRHTLWIRTNPTILYVQNSNTFEFGPEASLRASMKQESSGIQLDIASLMNHPLLRKNAIRIERSDIEEEMVHTLQNEYEKIVSFLSESEQKKLEGYSIVSDPDGRSEVWVEVRELKREINIYPALIRGVFLLYFRKYGLTIQDSIFDLKNENNQSPNSKYRNELMEKEALNISECFQRAFSFAIAHEIAHVLLDGESESDADELATKLMYEIYSDVYLGVFDDIFFRSFSEKETDVFGNISNDQLRVFESRLSELKGKLTPTKSTCTLPRYLRKNGVISEYYTNENSPYGAWKKKEDVNVSIALNGQTVKHGWGCYWHENGHIKSKGIWNHGVRGGLWKIWNDTGRQVSDQIFETIPENEILEHENSTEIDCPLKLPENDDGSAYWELFKEAGISVY